jgi:hypothetical protein
MEKGIGDCYPFGGMSDVDEAIVVVFVVIQI